MTNVSTSPPAPPASPPPITVPAVALSWAKVGAICFTLLVFLGGSFLTLIGIVYGNLKESVSRIETKVNDLDSKIVGAAKDAGSLQVLLNEAPDLRKNIQETHDTVLRHDARFDNLDRSLNGMSASVSTLAAATEKTNENLKEIRSRLSGVEDSIRRIPGSPK